MSKAISKRLQVKVLDALRLADTPLTTSEVAMLVNKSYESTRQALLLVEAERVDNSFPTEWRISGSHTPAELQRVPSKHSETDLVVGATHYGTPVAVWNEAKAGLGKSISELSITPDSDPAEVALKLGNVASSIGYLAYKLNEYATRPDWYDALSKEG